MDHAQQLRLGVRGQRGAHHLRGGHLAEAGLDLHDAGAHLLRPPAHALAIRAAATLMTVIPGRIVAASAASSPRTASPCITTMSLRVRRTCPTRSPRCRNRATNAGSSCDPDWRPWAARTRSEASAGPVETVNAAGRSMGLLGDAGRQGTAPTQPGGHRGVRSGIRRAAQGAPSPRRRPSRCRAVVPHRWTGPPMLPRHHLTVASGLDGAPMTHRHPGPAGGRSGLGDRHVRRRPAGSAPPGGSHDPRDSPARDRPRSVPHAHRPPTRAPPSGHRVRAWHIGAPQSPLCGPRTRGRG